MIRCTQLKPQFILNAQEFSTMHSSKDLKANKAILSKVNTLGSIQVGGMFRQLIESSE